MLIFSTGIILYTGLFQSRGGAYLLTTPAAPDRIFAYKFFEAMAYSSWAFLLLGSPMMVSFGIVEDADLEVLRDLPGLLPRVRADPGEPGSDRLPSVVASVPAEAPAKSVLAGRRGVR